MVTFSPVFDSPNKGLAVGVQELKKAVLSVSIPVIALGGILTQKQIDVLSRCWRSRFCFNTLFCGKFDLIDYSLLI